MYIDECYKIHISREVKSNYYQSLSGTIIRLPERNTQYPSKDALKFRKLDFRN